MRDETILAEVFVGDRAPTGNTLHTKDGSPVAHPDYLRIIRFNGDLDCYLIHYDSKGNELTDTCHFSSEEAMRQAEFEFAVTPSEWKTPQAETMWGEVSGFVVPMRLDGRFRKFDTFRLEPASPDVSSRHRRVDESQTTGSEFPSSWSDDEIMHHISDVATDPASVRTPGRGGREIVEGTRDGVDIRVVVEADGSIVTGFPTNVPRNP